MKRASVVYKMLSGLLSLALVLQVVAPVVALPPSSSFVSSATAASRQVLSPLGDPRVGETAVSAAAAEPNAPAQPLSVSRTQSTFTNLSSDLIITYTVQNNLAPQRLPILPADATPDEIVDVMADFDLEADPHTLRNVILVAAPTDDSAILATSHPANIDDGQYVFSLDNLPPQASAAIVITATTPASVSAVTPLVEATGWASLKGREVTADAATAVVLSPDFSQWLIKTIDADTEDEEMLQTLGQIGGDPAAIFSFARDFGYEAYRGSLRGTRGTLWSRAGNSLDQSSLLIAMLRANGIPARYRHGSLSQTDAQTLIAGMFPAPTTIVGQVAPEIPVSDPVNDPDLIAEVQDHWWVEAYIDGAWTNLDPSFAGAAMGQLFAGQIAGDGTDRIAELTDDFRPKVTITLDVETYNQLNAGGQPTIATHLDHTFRIVEIATAAVVFANQVTSDAQSGMVYATTSHTYTPFLHVNDNDEIIFGDPYQEVLTNFPLATTFVTGAWLRFEIEDVDGEITSYERALRDRLGYEVRTYGGSPDIMLDGDSAGIFSEFDIYSLSFFPGRVPTEVYEVRRAELAGVLGELADDTARMEELAALEPLNSAQQSEAGQIRARYQLNLSLFLNNVSLGFAEAADRASQIAQEGLYVKAYHDDPRLVIVSHEVVSDTTELNVDLRTTLERTIAYPGQGEPATFGYNLHKGINESWLEGEVLSAAADATVLTTAQVMQAASEQGIEFVYIGEANLALLDTIDLNEEAKARITTAVLDGKIVNIPTSAPLIDGEPATGWWEIDPETGETIGVMENGLHNALIEFVGNLLFGVTVGRIADFMIGATAATWDFLGKQVFKATGSGDFGTPAKNALGNANRGIACLMGDKFGCAGGKGYLDYGYAAMEALLNYLDKNDPPLPDLLLGNTIFTPTQTSDTAVLNVSANASGGSITADLQTSFTQLADADGGLSFYAAALDPLVSGKSGGRTAVNHTNSASLTLTDADLQLAAPAGSLSVAGQPVTPGDGLAISDFDGTLDITAVAPDSDQVLLDGGGDLFALTAVPNSSSIAPIDEATFDVDLTTTIADAVTVTVSAPDGWAVAIDDAGEVTATPPSGAAPAEYTLAITAQPAAFPHQILTAEHTVTVIPHDGMRLDVAPDPLLTVPMGPKSDDAGFVNTGQAQVPGAAYLITLTNTATIPHTYTLSASGLPAGWTLLGGESDTTLTLPLPPGEMGQIGLYVTPDGLPSPGATYDIMVTATDENGLSANDGETFTMPAVPFSYVTVAPATQVVTTTGETLYDVTVNNVGNAAGEFGLTADAYNVDGSVTFGSLPAPVNLSAGDRATFPVTVSTDGAPARGDVQLFFGSPVANTIYTPTAIAALQVVSVEAEPIINGANRCQLPVTLHDAFFSLATAVDELSFWCEEGDCPLPLRDEVVAAGESLLFYARNEARPATAPALDDVEAALATLSTQTDDGDILDTVADLATAVYDLGGQSCEVEQHRPDGRFTPYVDAVLLGDAADFTLDVTNDGAITTTYAITVTGLSGGDLLFNETIAPGATITLPVTSTPSELGVFDLAAEIVPVAPDVTLPIAETAVARLNVVDKFVQVTQVTADPPFVETGNSSAALSIDVTNIANVARAATAHTEILAPGGAISYTNDTALTVLIGDPRTYTLDTIDTSGWTEGVYTITVELRDGDDDLIPDGSNYGYLAVGQAVGVSHSVQPAVVAPGAVTVTTAITTEILSGVVTETQSAVPLWPATGLRPVIGDRLSVNGDRLSVIGDQSPATDPHSSITNQGQITDTRPASLTPSPYTITGTVILRYEQDEAVLTGTWSSHNNALASNGSYLRADTAGETAIFTVTGTWVSLGFLAGRYSGHAEVFIDGASQGVLDLYRRETTPVSVVYDGLISATHTISVTALGTANPYASAMRVSLDYLDVYNGGSYADGAFEENDTRLFLSTGWDTRNDAAASGGGYIREDNATAWFPFTGDSVTYQALAYNGGGTADVYIDGIFQTRLNLHNLESITRTLSFNNLGAGPHVMQVNGYRGNVTVDAFITPGSAPFYIDPNPGGFTRFEEDDPAFLYNGVPFVETAQSWTRGIHDQSEASGGQYIYSRTAGDTARFTFVGTWASVGFFTDDDNGMAEIFIDGVSQGTVDLYSNEQDVTSFTYDGLISGTHTLAVTVLGTSNPLSGDEYVRLDYVDAWDGASLADGRFEEMDERVLLSGGWSHVADADTSGGSYVETSLHGEPTFWFPFTGDSITYQAFDYFRSNEVAIYIDEAFQGYYDIRTGSAPTITHSFDNLGSGLHMLKVRHYRGEATLDAFITPAVSPPAPPPTPTTFTRYEEDDPAVRYNGLPYATTASTWNRYDGVTEASNDQYIRSGAPGDWVSFDFSGTWVGVGFATDRYGGQAEIFIDGVSQGIVDLYSREDDVASYVYDGLADATHTISATVLSTANPYASGTRMHVDYFDTWSGDPLPAGTYEESHPLVFRGDSYDSWDVIAEAAASGGSYMSDGFQQVSTVWFPFTGDSVTFLGLAKGDADEIRISIDGVSQGVFNLYSGAPMTRTFSFDGLGGGPHVMEVRHYKGEPNVDAFVVPGIPPFTETPVYTGVVRYEEDDPALVYNGDADFPVRPQSWVLRNTWTDSGGWHVYSGAAGDTVSLTFDGRWAGIGFIGRDGVSEAEVFIDGVSQGILDLDNGGAGELFHSFGDLITGTHTLSVSVVSGYVIFDYIDVWDGQPTPDETTNIRRAEDNSRLYYSVNAIDKSHPNAIEGDFIGVPIFNFPANLWYNFVGDSFTFYYFSERNGGSVNVYVDGQFVETVSQDYEFSPQPFGVSYDGFGEGPHVVRVENVSAIRADAFRSPADPLPYMPSVEWFDTTPNGGSGAFGTPAGAIMGMAAGDVNGDGATEIVLPSDTYVPDVAEFVNSIFIFRGDGADTGDGDPIIERIDIEAGGVGREFIGSVAIAELDGQPGAEIVAAGNDNMYAFHNDGSTYWMTDTLPARDIRGTPAIGNLDLDPEPEIVVNLQGMLAVFEHDGAIAWTETFPADVGMPLLVDMDENGTLDIVAYDIAGTVYLYDYNYGSPTLAWSTTLSSTIDFIFGGPAFADVDGQQPGGDDGPEIAITSNGRHTVLDADGSVVWSTALDPGDGGGVSIADVDGDGEIELVTGIKYDDGAGEGRMYTLNADGTILWHAPAYDSTSANSQSVLDLNGDGVYEIAWNGAQHGFTIYNGVDGSILYNEPLIESLTGTEYPIFADVDDDGYAEVAVPYNDGLAVVGMDGVWGESRPVWNQHTYHVTNVNDDLTIPQSEANSWDVHNTFRTQWPENVVLPVYDVTITHTAGISGVTVLTDTFSTPPTAGADPAYRWEYTQPWSQHVVTRTFASELSDLRPGTSHLVAQSTELAYTFPGGGNGMALPPLYVSVPHIVAVAPLSQTVGAGGTAVFTATLSNPGLTTNTYTLSAVGPTADWVEVPSSVLVPAESVVSVPLTVTAPAGATPDDLPLLLDVTTGSGGADQATATLAVIDSLDLSLTPATQTAVSGQPAVYTLALTNLTEDDQTYALTTSGLPAVTAPPSVAVGAGEMVTVSVTAVDSREGPLPFTIHAASATGSAEADATLLNEGSRRVTAALAPDPALSGPGATTPLTLTLSNMGNLEDTYDLTVDAPAGWETGLAVNGRAVDALTIPPHLFNTADVRLLVTPAADSAPGDYGVAVTAVSQADSAVTAVVTGTVQVGQRGVGVELTPVDQTIPANQTAIWEVMVTNHGSIADTFNLAATGLAGAAGVFTPDSVSLAPGQSETVQLTADGLDFALPSTYPLAVLATSQAEPAIQGVDEGALTLTAYEAAGVAWDPAAQTVTDTLQATYHLVISNDGNLPRAYDLSVTVDGGGARFTPAQIVVPAGGTAVLPVTARVSAGGTYQVVGTAVSPGGFTYTETAMLTVNVIEGRRIYLPILFRP